MLTQEEAEAWAHQHGATLKVNFAAGDAVLQIGAFVAYTNRAVPYACSLPELVADLERQMNDQATQPEAAAEDVTRPR
jgi:hypothetical protein